MKDLYLTKKILNYKMAAPSAEIKLLAGFRVGVV